MKKKRILFIIFISAISLMGLVVMQINWIIHASQLRESQLKHRITLASYKIGYRFEKDTITRQWLSKSILDNGHKSLLVNIKDTTKARIDSILHAEFRYHQINLAYNFHIVDKKSCYYSSSCKTDSYPICLEGMLGGEKAELRFSFPNKNEYIYAQMGWMFTGSVLLIGLVSLCFGLTIQTILQQKRLSEMTSDFINNMTHELKTPIATVSLASNMLRREKIVSNPEKIVHYSGIISEENRKLQEQVEQVLRLAKLEKGDFKLNKCPVNIHEIIQNALSTIDLQVKSRNGKIKCYLNAVRQEVAADVTHLTNVVSNLLDNANKYSPEKPEITIMTHNREDGIVISVEDKGIGMSKDKQKYIFQKFYRVPTGNIHDVKGFGLGLAYVKMMVDAHKGNIYLNSEPGKGSRFDIFLPYS